MLISVIVPVYNAEKFLSKAVESVINQSYGRIELILVNDGSTDNSEEICNKYAVSDNRIKVITQKNSGPAAARNAGIRQAAGDFIFFLDADDFINKAAFEVLIAKYNQYHPDLVMANFSKYENNGKMVKQKVTFCPDEKPFEGGLKELSKTEIAGYIRHFLKHPSNHLISYCWARLYKASIIKDNIIFANEDMQLFEDFIFNLEYLKYTGKAIFVNENLYTYTMHNSHVSKSMVIINSDSLLHDMNIFKDKAKEFFSLPGNKVPDLLSIDKEIGHALVHYVIIFFLRTCRQATVDNKKMIYGVIEKIVSSSILKESLQYYCPSKGNSKILPLLMKLKLIDLIIIVCRYKAYKRYGKPEYQ